MVGHPGIEPSRNAYKTSHVNQTIMALVSLGDVIEPQIEIRLLACPIQPIRCIIPVTGDPKDHLIK